MQVMVKALHTRVNMDQPGAQAEECTLRISLQPLTVNLDYVSGFSAVSSLSFRV
jgi:hypothetical protein